MEGVHRILALALSAAFLGSCGGTASNVCSIECECEHCNDIAEEFICAERQAEADVADAYGCADEWEEWAVCFEERGTCDEEDIRYTTRAPGSCSGEIDVGFPCATDNECSAIGAETCSGGSCKMRACAGGNNQPCQSNADCSDGTDRCEVESDRLRDCQAAASAHDGQFGGDETQPGNP